MKVFLYVGLGMVAAIILLVAGILLYAFSEYLFYGVVLLLLFCAGAVLLQRMGWLDGEPTLSGIELLRLCPENNDFIHEDAPQKIERLLHNGADVNTRRKRDRRTPLMLISDSIGAGQRFRFQTAAGRHIEESVVQLLIRYGADVNLKDKDGFTALILAAGHSNDRKLANALIPLLDAGANVNARTNSGYTALMEGSRTGSDQGVKTLINRGAKATVTDNQNRTAKTHALQAMEQHRRHLEKDIASREHFGDLSDAARYRSELRDLEHQYSRVLLVLKIAGATD